MPTGKGFWLDPKTGQLHRVTTHNDWLLDARNQEKAGLSPAQVQVLNLLAPSAEDEIRMVGVMAGLIRLRDYCRHVSVQFYCQADQANEMLSAAVAVLPQVTSDPHCEVVAQNLLDDSVARLSVAELRRKLEAGETVLESAEPIPFNEELRQRVAGLLS